MLVTAEGVNMFLKDKCENLLEESSTEYIHYTYYHRDGISYSKWMNTRYVPTNQSIYSWPIFCFFHYDSFNCDEKSSIYRKRDRFIDSISNKGSINLHYYYRYCESTNFDFVKNELKEMCKIIEDVYSSNSRVYLVSKIDSVESGISTDIDGNIIHTTFHSPHSWIRADDNWNGATDNHLFDLYYSNVLAVDLL
jgi:hypothetical protein